jgi:hypothetical protein
MVMVSHMSSLTVNVEGMQASLTSNDTANTNRRLEVTAAGGAVELLALLLRLTRRLQPPRVLHGDLVALCRTRAVALGDDGFADTHCDR